MPRKKGPGTAGPITRVTLGGGILKLLPEAEIERLAKSYDLRIEDLRPVVKTLRASWALREQRWRDARNPAAADFKRHSEQLRNAWQRLSLAAQQSIAAVVVVHVEMPELRPKLGVVLECLPDILGGLFFHHDPGAAGLRGLPPHTREAILVLSQFWRQAKGSSTDPRWSDAQGKWELGPGPRFVCEILAVVTGTKLTPDQLRDAQSQEGD
jgi:hypothetical protein